jgi:mRNA interferase MazF
MTKGEIWTTTIPPTGGHEQHGTRPVLVIADTSSPMVMVIPFTSNTRALRLPHTVQIKPSENNGLSASTIALVLQLRALDRRRLIEKLGNLESQPLDSVVDALRSMLQI